MLASEVGRLLRGCEWVGIPFAGGMSEVPHIDARTILVNDRHRHVVNLARVAVKRGDELATEMDAEPFHPDVLKRAQQRCVWWESLPDDGYTSGKENYDAALAYAIAVWMGRSAKAGTVDEFKGQLALRWNAGGGDSNVRYRSGAEAVREFGVAMRHCAFSTLDFREFLGECLKRDRPRHGIYCDPPFPDATDEYKHSFAEQDHRDLARLAATFAQARMVMRFYDHPLVRELYPESRWTWKFLTGRKQSNEAAPEVLLVNNLESS